MDISFLPARHPFNCTARNRSEWMTDTQNERYLFFWPRTSCHGLFKVAYPSSVEGQGCKKKHENLFWHCPSDFFFFFHLDNVTSDSWGALSVWQNAQHEMTWRLGKLSARDTGEWRALRVYRHKQNFTRLVTEAAKNSKREISVCVQRAIFIPVGELKTKTHRFPYAFGWRRLEGESDAVYGCITVHFVSREGRFAFSLFDVCARQRTGSVFTNACLTLKIFARECSSQSRCGT